MRIKGFTLAEVLITLAIIGVIAAISVPSLIQKTNSEELKVQLKKNYATVNQALAKLAFDNGSLKSLCTANYNDCFSNLMGNYVKTIKKCPVGTAAGNCWNNDGEWYTPSGAAYGTSWRNAIKAQSGMIFNNGTFLLLSYDPTCSSDGRFCGGMIMDTNGFKKPNIVSKDIFIFYYDDNTQSILPDGPSLGTGSVCDTTSENGSFQCSEDRLIGKGW